MESGNKVKIIIFIIFLLGFIGAGLYFTLDSYNIKTEKKELITRETKDEDIRIDKEKEYIYYTDNDRIVDELDIEYKNVVINFAGQNAISDYLNNKTKSLKETLKYDDTLEDESYNKLSYAQYLTYNQVVYSSYISLVVDFYNFTRENLVSYTGSEAYVFNKITGKLLSKSEILAIKEINEDDLLNKIKEYLEGQNLLKSDEEKINVESTMSSNQNPVLYIDKLGRPVASILVKNAGRDYNEVILLN